MNLYHLRSAIFNLLIALTNGAWVTAGFAAGMILIVLAIWAFVVIDSCLHKRKLRRMQRETMEAHQRQIEQTRRASFLP